MIALLVVASLLRVGSAIVCTTVEQCRFQTVSCNDVDECVTLSDTRQSIGSLSAAQRMCERVGKSLVAPGSDAVNDHIYQLCNNANSFIDIVAVRNAAACNIFAVASTVGPSGSGVVMAPFFKWALGEPNNGNATAESCSRGDLRESCVSFVRVNKIHSFSTNPLYIVYHRLPMDNGLIELAV